MSINFYLVFCGVYSSVLVDVTGGGAHYKPCSRLKNTVNYNKVICVDDGTGNFEDQSARNCREMRLSCPEFNKAECVRLSNISFNGNNAAANASLPCCRLYYETTSVQMEVFYTLQYGADAEVPDIVEVRRVIHNQTAFGDRRQEDWPDSVADPRGQRGLKWTTVDRPLPPINISGEPSDLCRNDSDGRCNVNLVLYLALNHSTGFDASLLPTMSSEENRTRADARYTIGARGAPCRALWVDEGGAARACQLFYTYSSKWTRQGGGRAVPVHVEFEFLEVQVYWAARTNGLVLRYAYWSREDPETRAEIFDRA